MKTRKRITAKKNKTQKNVYRKIEPLNDSITSPSNVERDLVKLFNTPFAPNAIKSNDDFYTYIDYKWIKEKTIFAKQNVKFYAQLDNFRITQEKVYYELIDIIKQTKDANVKRMYHSLLHLNPASAKSNVTQSIIDIDKLLGKQTVIPLLAHINKNELVSWGSPIVWSMSVDEKHASKYTSYIAAGELSIYDYMVYVGDQVKTQEQIKYHNKIKKQYFAYIADMFDTCIGKNHGLNAIDVWNVEVSLLDAMGCTSLKTSPHNYNEITRAESSNKFGFDFSGFCTELGYDNNSIPNKFVTTNTNFLKCTMKLLNDNWNTPEWRAYWIYLYVRQIMRFHKQWRKMHYDFNGSFIMGQPADYPDDIYTLFGMSYAFNSLLTNKYTAINHDQDKIDYVTGLSGDLKNVFKKQIRRNAWLSDYTKKYALLKLKHLTIHIGQPALPVRDDPNLKYDKADAWGNLLKLTHHHVHDKINLDGRDLVDMPLINWNTFKLTGTQSYVVNAYYTPTLNSIYMPLGYIQKPFIDLDERGIEYNLAHIGYTIAHELSHSLDDSGSKYKYDGNLHDWWTPRDKKKFKAKVKDIIKQYETVAKRDGVDFNAEMSAGEDIADISGLAICEEYLRDFQITNKEIVPIKALSFETFFMYIAQQDRQKIYKEAIESQLKTNPHPMNKYRTNCPLMRLRLFKSIYNVKKGDGMYWESMDTIW